MPAGDAATARPPLVQIRAWLEQVPDPEIPVLSVVDLGVVRALNWYGDELRVVITPTYSGCPATQVIAADIERALRAHGIARLRLETRLAPAWTSDWISAAGRDKLRRYGIAPPAPSNRPIECPHCGSSATEPVSEFGSTPCKALYRCRDCLEPFDYFKCLR